MATVQFNRVDLIGRYTKAKEKAILEDRKQWLSLIDAAISELTSEIDERTQKRAILIAYGKSPKPKKIGKPIHLYLKDSDRSRFDWPYLPPSTSKFDYMIRRLKAIQTEKVRFGFKETDEILLLLSQYEDSSSTFAV